MWALQVFAFLGEASANVSVKPALIAKVVIAQSFGGVAALGVFAGDHLRGSRNEEAHLVVGLGLKKGACYLQVSIIRTLSCCLARSYGVRLMLLAETAALCTSWLSGQGPFLLL